MLELRPDRCGLNKKPDPTAALCRTLLLIDVVGEGSFIGHNAVVEGCDLRAGLRDLCAQCIPHTEVGTLPTVRAGGSEFSEDVVRTNNSLVEGYRRLEGEF
ncbi:MAG: hypothetical protein F4X98_11535 [Gammaproteobacteria bacterium]|nr:hypothetical protein [Gammaproteobacteria bacterium]